MAQLVKNPPAMWETWVQSLGWKIPLRMERLPTPVFWPGEVHGLYIPWGHKEFDTTERLSFSLKSHITRIMDTGRERIGAVFAINLAHLLFKFSLY